MSFVSPAVVLVEVLSEKIISYVLAANVHSSKFQTRREE
jgi:hypothetical protein